jgi:hypothetical protein
MSETRAVANLPNLNIEVLHREAPGEGAEFLSITLRGTPDLATAMGLLDPFRLLRSDPALDPWQAWLRLVDPFGLWRLPAAMLTGPRTPR